MYQINIRSASSIATKLLSKKITQSNISYLIQYGVIDYINQNNTIYLHKEQFYDYFQKQKSQEQFYKQKFGNELNWALSFEQCKESETTKHVHRLHPYKGKFIPQLVEYFLDEHTDNFKKEVYFKKGDIVLDPFCGSGTTLIQANELGMHSIGIDISPFNAFIANTKLSKANFKDLGYQLEEINSKLNNFIKDKNNIAFENELLEGLSRFNNQHFPTPEFRKKVRNKEINDKIYGKEKEELFLPIYQALLNKYNIQISFTDKNKASLENKFFLDKWYIKPIRDEIDVVFNEIKTIKNKDIKRIIVLILSRTIRSCRATTHADLATLKEPQLAPYYCKKHSKICKPLFTIKNWFSRYSKDTIKRLKRI